MQPTFGLDRSAADLGEERLEGGVSAPSDETLSRRSPNVTPLMENLPGSDTKRWVVRRKAAVVAAVRSGRITVEDACRTYQLSEEELLSWERAFEINGLAGLRTTRIQQYRRSSAARRAAVSLKQLGGAGERS
jgi:transposase-like protein